MFSSMDEDLCFLEVGPVVHSQCLTIASRILHLCFSLDIPSASLQAIARFSIIAYFPVWFETKKNSQIIHGLH